MVWIARAKKKMGALERRRAKWVARVVECGGPGGLGGAGVGGVGVGKGFGGGNMGRGVERGVVH